jgi:hypothetical protein
MAGWPRRNGAAPDPAIHKITGVRTGLTEDVRSRQFRYLVSMTVRTVCFVLAIVTSGWLRWIFFTAAVFLPYVAVVLANGGRESAEGIPLVPPPAQREIGPGPSSNAPAA